MKKPDPTLTFNDIDVMANLEQYRAFVAAVHANPRPRKRQTKGRKR